MRDETVRDDDPRLSTEARTIVKQLRDRADISDITLESDGASYIASARGRAANGDTIFRMSRELTPEDALTQLLAGYRLMDVQGGVSRRSPYERHLHAAKVTKTKATKDE